MSTENLDALQSALLGSSFNEDEQIAVKAEDLTQGGGFDFSKHYFEPETGSTYLIKFLPNPGGELITHRSVYKHLPDPDRKGKTFHYVSSGNARTCPALELFFELNALKKEQHDAIAEKKIEKYLSRTNQACVKVQILQSPKKEEIGMIRIMLFSTFGPNATVANLINQKINPTKEQLEQGYEKEDIFNIFESSVMSMVVTEADYDGVKGRDFTKSSWAPKKRGAISINEAGESYEFKATDNVGGKLTDEATPWFKTFFGNLMNENYDIYRWFAYKEPGDEKMDKETNEYIKSVFKKVEEIIPIIRDGSLTDIASYGRKDSSFKKDDSEKPANVMREGIPDELQNAVVNQDVTKETKGSEDDDDDDDIANILDS